MFLSKVWMTVKEAISSLQVIIIFVNWRVGYLEKQMVELSKIVPEWITI